MYPPTTSTMRIDRIEPSRRRKDRVLVFLEGGDLLRVTEQELLVFGLRPGLELPEQLLAQVEQSAKRSEMKARGARLTGSRMLSKKQVMEHLTRKGGDRELAEDTAQWLEELGAVDEYLINRGRLHVLARVDDLRVCKKDAAAMPPLVEAGGQLVQSVTDAFLSAAQQ